MKIYLAARYSRREELKTYAKDLVKAGHTIVSTWLNERVDHKGAYDKVTPRFMRDHAKQDMLDLAAADTIISFTEPAGSYQRGGGRHVEFGYGLAAQKNLYLVGPREVIFHFLPGLKIYEDFAALKEALVDKASA